MNPTGTAQSEKKPHTIVLNGNSEATTIPIESRNNSTLRIVPIGAGAEVGRSCIIVYFQGKAVMVF